jgi:hypothetical protein
MAAANRVKLPPNVRLRQHESHLLAAAAAEAAAHDHLSIGSTPTAVAAAGANGSSKDVDAMEAAVCSAGTAGGAAGKSSQLRSLMQHVRGALRTTGELQGAHCCRGLM